MMGLPRYCRNRLGLDKSLFVERLEARREANRQIVVDVFTSGVKRVFFDDSGINLNASTDNVIMNGGDLTGANNITCSTIAGRFSGPFSTQRCATLGSTLTYDSGSGALSLVSQTDAVLSTVSLPVGGGGGGGSGFYEYSATVSTQTPPPDDGHIQWNNTTQQLATILYVSHLTRGGNDIDVSAGTSIPIYAFLMNGWKLKPQEANHTLSVTDGILLVNG